MWRDKFCSSLGKVGHIFQSLLVLRVFQGDSPPSCSTFHSVALPGVNFNKVYGLRSTCVFVRRYDLTGMELLRLLSGGNAGPRCQNLHHACGRSLSLLCLIPANKALHRAVNHNTFQLPDRPPLDPRPYLQYLSASTTMFLRVVFLLFALRLLAGNL